MEKDTITVQIRIEKALHEKAKQDAAKLGLNFSAYVRLLLSTQQSK